MYEDEINDFKPLLQEYNVSGSVLKINLTDYSYSCGDGCCYNYGTITKVNGIELPCHNQDAGTILSQVLEHLGYKVEIEYGDDVELMTNDENLTRKRELLEKQREIQAELARL